MPPRRQFYDPIVMPPAPSPPPLLPEPVTTTPAQPIQGVYIEKGGIHLHIDEIVRSLRQMADEVAGLTDAPTAQEALLGAAASFDGVYVADPYMEPEAPAQEVVVPPTPEESADDPRVFRVEIYPDLDGKWYPRSVDAEGNILETRNGSFDHDYIVRTASERWRGVEIREITDAQMDSVWEDQHAAFGWNGRRRPSPRRIWAT